jgi:hypothetical protein
MIVGGRGVASVAEDILLSPRSGLNNQLGDVIAGFKTFRFPIIPAIIGPCALAATTISWDHITRRLTISFTSFAGVAPTVIEVNPRSALGIGFSSTVNLTAARPFYALSNSATGHSVAALLNGPKTPLTATTALTANSLIVFPTNASWATTTLTAVSTQNPLLLLEIQEADFLFSVP